MLLVPDLMAGVARIEKDRPTRALGPPNAFPMRVANSIMRGRTQDAVPGQPFRDGEDAPAVQELTEDPLDDRTGDRVDFETA